MKPKRVTDSQVTISHLMERGDANLLGNVHGGVLMKLIDEVGGIAAARHSQRPVATVAIDSVTFILPIRVGDLVVLTASLTWVGRTSMEVEVCVEAENIFTGQRAHTNSAYVVYVAMDENSKPTEVPRLIAETEEQRRRMIEADVRQTQRLGHRS
ncbi:MAG: acyl-CoA thioesterase [Anaerolineaceae bacterium 4572_32.1]|nr:MAG: acyl-CoA thioesterase [Anaerolineaceae bacterium 4572_32.1]